MGCCSSSDTKDAVAPNEEDHLVAFQLDKEEPPEREQSAGGHRRKPDSAASTRDAKLANGRKDSATIPSRSSQSSPDAALNNSSIDGHHSTILYSPADGRSFCSASIKGSIVGSPSGKLSEASFAFGTTNSSFGNITATHVENFVKGVDQRADDVRSMCGPSEASLQSVRRLRTCADVEIQETVIRMEIFATYSLTAKMIRLAAKKVVPSVRRRKRNVQFDSRKQPMVIVTHRSMEDGAANGAQAEGDLIAPQVEKHLDPLEGTSLSKNAKENVQVEPVQYDDDIPVPSNYNSVQPSGPTPAMESEKVAILEVPETTADPQSGCGEGQGENPEEAGEGAGGESLQLLGLSCADIDIAKKSTPVIVTHWDHLSHPKADETLNMGGTMFTFVCKPFSKLDDNEKELARILLPPTAFQDECRENGVPIIDVDALKLSYPTLKTEKGGTLKDESIDTYSFIAVRTTFLLPGARLENFTVDLLASPEYHRETQPGPPKLLECNDKDSVRFVKTFVPIIFSVTMQLRVSEFTDPKALEQFQWVDGMTPAKVILLERTKRNIEKQDMILKCKSYELYYPVTGGVLCTGLTVVVNSKIPRVIASLIHTFGGQGAKDGGVTADKTRQFLIRKFGDSRQM